MSPRPRRGSTYAMILMVCMLLMVISLGGLTAQRVRGWTMNTREDSRRADLLAQSALDKTLAALNADPWWRFVHAGAEAQYSTPREFGGGTIRWQVDDLVDNDLADEAADPVRVYGCGQAGRAGRAYSVMAWPSGQALDVLRTAVHASGSIELRGPLDVRSGPVSSNGAVDAGGGLLLGDVESDSIVDPENVSGEVLVPAPPKLMPARAVWDVYSTFAVEIRVNDLLTGRLEDVLVSAANHPVAGKDPSPDGLYSINVPAATTFRIRRCRIEGTLLVELSGDGSQLHIDGDVLWKPHRPDLPALVVYTKKDLGTQVEVVCDGLLDEAASGTNFNPPDTPYYGAADGDATDTYPASIRGVIHVIRDVTIDPLISDTPLSDTTIDAVSRITGCIIVEGDLRIEADSRLSADPALTSQPPLGYTTAPDRDNLLTNGGFEDGLGGWFSPGGGATLEWKSDGGRHSGDAYVKIKDRIAPAAGVAQDVTGRISSDTQYTSEVWVHTRDKADEVRLCLLVSSGTGNSVACSDPVPVTPDWTRVTATFTPSWSGGATSIVWVVQSMNTTDELYVDDALLAPVTEEAQPATLIPVPGTFRVDAVP